MSEFTPYPMHDVLTQLSDILKRRLRYLEIDPDAYNRVARFLADNAISTRWYTMTSQPDVEAMWGDIRSDATLLDAVMSATLSLRTVMLNGYVTFDQAALLIANDLSTVAADREGSLSVVDEDLHERMSNKDIGALYADNAWLVTLYLAAQLDIEALMGTEFLNAPAPTGRPQ